MANRQHDTAEPYGTYPMAVCVLALPGGLASSLLLVLLTPRIRRWSGEA